MIKTRLLAAGRLTIHILCILSISVPRPVFSQEDLLVGLEQSAERLRESAERLRPILDRSQFDLYARLESTDFDAESIIDFVTNEIRVEIYAGALRGALGTLFGGAGNSLDQALLTATLLGDAGYDVVIRRGTLSSESAMELINRMFSTRAPATSPWLEAPDTVDDAARAKRVARREAWIEAAEAKTKRLEDALDDAGVDFEGDRTVTELLAEARDYYWVEYRTGPSADRQQVHPALGRTPNVEVEETYSEGIPADQSQQVTIEVIVDQRRGSDTLESHLFSPIRLLGPELADLSLQISLLPDQLLNGEAPLDTARLAADTSFIYPIVNGEMPAGAQALSLRGFLVPMESMNFGAADYFETVSEKGAQAIDAVAALGGEEESGETQVAIEAVRLRVIFRMPNGSERIAEREWFSESRDIGELSIGSTDYRRALVAGLSRSHQFSFATGVMNNAYFFDHLLDNFESLQSAINVAKSIDAEDCVTLDCFLNLDWEPVNRSSSAFFPALDEIDNANAANTVRYRHVPGLYIQSSPLLPLVGDDPTASSRFDIVSNAKRSLKGSGREISVDSHRQILAGVWETQIETDVLGKPNAAPPDPDLELELEALREINFSDIDSFSRGSSIARAVKRDLDSGYVVFAEAGANVSGSDGTVRWWRVNPLTAETLGMNQYGGAVATEALAYFAIGLVLLVVSLGATIYCNVVNNHGLAACFACLNAISAPLTFAFAVVSTIGADPLDYGGYFIDEFRQIQNWCTN